MANRFNVVIEILRQDGDEKLTTDGGKLLVEGLLAGVSVNAYSFLGINWSGVHIFGEPHNGDAGS